jgi:hypothetical protein
MGTAFGLDATFDAEAGSAPTSSHTLPPPARPAWESRLIRRSGL